MSYIDPQTVRSPRNRIGSVHVLYNSGPDPKGESWSVALLEYDGRPGQIGIRWNGREGEAGVGNPQSRAKPTWFVVPDPLSDPVREKADELSSQQEGGLLAGYRDMAADRQREAEAQEWSEGLIGDANHQEG